MGIKAYLQKNNIKQYANKLLIVFFISVFGALSTMATQRAEAAPGPVTGTVFHDVNANGVRDAGEGAFPNLAIVNLYNSSGTYVKSRTSDASGNYSIAGLSAGTYYVSVYNTSRAALLDTAPGLVNTIGVQLEPTYAGVGSGAGSGSGPICVGAAPTYTQRTNYATSPSEWTVGAQNGSLSGPCFGGRLATMSNPVLTTLFPPTYVANTDYTNINTALNTQKIISKVVVTTNGGVSNVDFGLSANAVTHTNTSGQGSLSQFINNANLIGGVRTMRFTPAVASMSGSGSNKWWHINQSSVGFPVISNNNTVIDGRAYSNTDALTQLDTNSGSITGAVVGTTNFQIADYQKPELEITGDPRANLATSLLQVSASNVTVANIGFNSSANYANSESYFVQQTGGVALTVENNLMGVNLATGANSANRPLFALQTAYIVSLNSTGYWRHNYISSNDTRGLVLAGGLLGAGNVVPLLLGDWMVEQNDGPSAGIAIGAGTTRIQITHNRMPIAALDAAPLNASLGLHTLTENTITGGGGVQLHASLQNTITKNIITNATGSNPGVSVGNLSTGNYISQNSFSGNGGNAIDLNSDGVSNNDLLRCLTVSPEIVGLANLGIARPTIHNVRLTGSTLTLNIGYCGIGVYNIELYKVAAGSGDGNAGEGAMYLGTFTGLTLLNGILFNQTIPINSSQLQAGDSITAIVTNPVTGDTSEFSPNAVAGTPPAIPVVAPDLTPNTDSGASNTDNVTSNTIPTFTGSCTNGETVTLYIDAIAVSPTQVCSGGSYSITPNTSVGEGAHNATVTFGNVTGESSQSPTLPFTIDTVAPATPTVPDLTTANDTGISSTDNTTNNNQPFFAGTCGTGETLQFYIDGQLAGSQACIDGGYSFQPNSPLGNGSHTIAVRSIDVAGNQSTQSSGLPFTIDTVAPGSPVIVTPTNGAVTNNTAPTISGSGESGATITVKNSDGATICTAVVNSGNWSCVPPEALVDATYQLMAIQTDVAGNVSGGSGSTTLTVDATAPAAPVVVSPVNNSSSNVTKPTFSGTANAYATVHVSIDGQSPVTVTADANGHWTYTPTASLSEATHSFNAVQLDAAGNSSAVSNTHNFTIDTTAPTVTVNKSAGQADPTADDVIRYTIIFSEPMNSAGFGPADVTLSSSPSSTAVRISNLTQLNTTTWQVEVTGMPNHTTLTASVAAHVAQDSAGNTNVASTSTDNSVTYSVDGPTITPLVTNDQTPAINGECSAGHAMSVVLNDPGTTTLNTTCSPTGEWNAVVPVALPSGTYNVLVRDDDAGVTNLSENQSEALVIDTTTPTVIINKSAGQADPTNVNSAQFSVVFSEPIIASSFTISDLTVTGTNGTLQLTQLDNLSWQVVVSDMASGDVVTVSLAANKVYDQANNQNADSTSTDNSITYDAAAPAAPVINTPLSGSVTNNATVSVQGTAEADTTLVVSIDGAIVPCVEASPVVVAAAGWTCTLTTPLSDGAHTVTARVADAAGNVSNNATTVTLTIDTTAPLRPGPPQLNSASDTGSFDNDNITYDATPSFSGTCVSGDIVTLYAGATMISQATCTNGAYTVVSTTFVDGEYDMSVTATDSASNTSLLSAVLHVIVDTVKPSTPTIVQPTDGMMTNDATLTLTGIGEPGAFLRITSDGVATSCTDNQSRVDNSGNWTCTLALPLGDGSHILRVVQTDTAGNASDTTPPVQVIIDTTPPATPNAPDLTPASDTGVSNTDNITDSTMPTFIGDCVNGTFVQLYVGVQRVAETACSANTYTLTVAAALSTGSYNFTVTVTDGAGNSSVVSSGLTVIIDTTPPATPNAPDLTPASDTGVSNTDNTTLQVKPSVTGNCTTGENIQLLADGIAVGQTVCADGSYSVTPINGFVEGSHTLTVTITDIAGNQSATSPSLVIIVDTTAPAAPILTAPTNNAQMATTNPIVIGTGVANTYVRMIIDDTPVTCIEATVIVDGNGNWQCTNTAPLSDGSHTLSAQLIDSAGNVSSLASVHTIIIDTTAPSPLDAPDMHSSTDTGLSNTDNLTYNTRPRFTGSCQTGDSIRLYLTASLVGQQTCSGNTYDIELNAPLTAGDYIIHAIAIDEIGNSSAWGADLTFTVDTTPPATPLITSPNNGSVLSDTTPTITGEGDNNTRLTVLINGSPVVCSEGSSIIVALNAWHCTVSPLLADGVHTVTAYLTDAAGNNSPQATNVTVSIDSTAPNTPTTPDLATASDTGISNSDNVTASANVTFNGTCYNGEVITLLVDAIVASQAACNNDTYTVTVLSLADGTHAISTYATDAAGNVSPVSSVLQITVDTAAPGMLSVPDLTSATDTGVSNTDNITSNIRPYFIGSCVSGSTVVLLAGANVIAQTTCSGATYNVTPPTPLADGSYQLAVVATDIAGNTSAPSATLTIVVDATPPGAPTLVTPPHNSATSNTKPPISGTAENGTIVQVTKNSSPLTCSEGSPLVVSNGNWLCTPSTAFAEGTHTIRATVTDAAGNVSIVSTTVTVTVDVTPPVRPTRPDLTDATDTGVSNTDNVTRNNTPSFSGPCTYGNTVRLRLSGVTVAQGACTNGSYLIALTIPLSEGQKSFSITEVDLAGNVSSPSFGLTVTIDTVAAQPALPDLDVDSDSGVSNTDNITNVSYPTITGTCQVNETVSVYFDGTLNRNALCYPPFYSQPLNNLSQGAHAVSIIVTDVAGNVSVMSNSLQITIDNLAPPNPVVTAPAASTGLTIGSAEYTSLGTAEIGSWLRMTENGTTVCLLQVGANGTWSCPLTNVSNGTHTYRYSATDNAGNSSGDNTTRTITVNRP